MTISRVLGMKGMEEGRLEGGRCAARASGAGRPAPGARAAAVLALAAALAAALAGCGVGKVAPAPRLLDLGADTAPAAAAPARGALVLAPVHSAPLPAGTAVVWRVQGEPAPQAYATYRWAAPPAELLGRRVAERLARQGPVLEQNLSAALPQLQLTLSRFEQEFAAGGAASQGRLAMQAVLVQGGRVLGQLRVDRSEPAPSNDAPGGAEALRRAADAAADELAAWLAQRVGPPPEGAH